MIWLLTSRRIENRLTRDYLAQLPELPGSLELRGVCGDIGKEPWVPLRAAVADLLMVEQPATSPGAVISTAVSSERAVSSKSAATVWVPDPGRSD